MDENLTPDAVGEGVVEDIEIRRSVFGLYLIRKSIPRPHSVIAIRFIASFQNEVTK
jgi:hypothetical protein